MTMKIIHINRNVIQQNAKRETPLPVCRIQTDSQTLYAMEVEIHGPSRMVYRPGEPLACGAKLWIETNAPISLTGEMEFGEMAHFS